MKIINILLLVLSTSLTLVFANYNYGDALDKSLLFFEAQRSGKLPANQRVKWRGDSGLRDGFQQGVNLVGGYYDAGDHVKFGLPMAFAVTMISWGAIDFVDEIKSSNQLGHTLEAIKWGTDYFLKAHTQANVLWGQVGDGNSDHYCWERAEDMSTSRTAYKIDAGQPGSDLAGETAAAFAAASIAFKHYDSAYSSLLLHHAKQLFTFADRFRGRYDNSIQNAKNFYASASGYSDELLWAATWLYQATGEDYYLAYVVSNGAYLGGTDWAVGEFSWDNKYAGVQILLTKVLLEGKGGKYTSTLQQYQAKAQYFACSCMQKNSGYNVPRTPGGLLYIRQWNNLQYVSSASFLLAAYSDYLSAHNTALKCPDGQIQPEAVLQFARSQADYILGKNPKSMSYLVGYGSNYPRYVHHRGASIPSMSVHRSTVGCAGGYEDWYHRNSADPNVIYGALIGGPDKYDQYTNERDDYEQSEPTISGTAPLIGLFAKLQGHGRPDPSYQKPVPVVSYGPYGQGSTYQKATPAVRHPYVSPQQTSMVPVVFTHSITGSWKVGTKAFYRHQVVIKNTSKKHITYLKMGIENLSGELWGLTKTYHKKIYELPAWLKGLKPGSQHSFVYIQGGPQAKVRILNYR
ncbi:hypothetical protein MKX03_021748 [Papaver bracteatum]|nr:hypothetical protein MKX03_021748 [Papaver bracteatum]